MLYRVILFFYMYIYFTVMGTIFLHNSNIFYLSYKLIITAKNRDENSHADNNDNFTSPPPKRGRGRPGGSRNINNHGRGARGLGVNQPAQPSTAAPANAVDNWRDVTHSE